MDRVAVGGLSLHETDVVGLERAKGASLGVRELADVLGASELVQVSTCNRLEIVYARESGHRPGRADHELLRRGLGLADDPLGARVFHHTGRAAARHLLRVVASLESLVVGEDQILGQVREAWQTSQAHGLVGPVLSPLFEAALQLGKQVRAQTDLSRHPVSVVSLAVQLVANHVPREARVALIGAGDTAAHAACSLGQAGFRVSWIANRTASRAAALAADVGAEVVALDDLRTGALPVQVVVSATSAPRHVLDAATLADLAARANGAGPLVAVDLALPRDLEIPDDFAPLGSADPAPGLHVDLETLRTLAIANQGLRREAARAAEELIERKLVVLERKDRSRLASGLLAGLLEEARETFEVELQRLLGGRLRKLSDDERRAVERWARTTFGRMAHLPARALRELVRDPTPTEGPGEPPGAPELRPEESAGEPELRPEESAGDPELRPEESPGDSELRKERA